MSHRGRVVSSPLGNSRPGDWEIANQFRPDETSKPWPITSKTKTPPHPASKTTSNSPWERMKKQAERRSVLCLVPDGGPGAEPREKGARRSAEPHIGPSRAIATRYDVGGIPCSGIGNYRSLPSDWMIAAWPTGCPALGWIENFQIMR